MNEMSDQQPSSGPDLSTGTGTGLGADPGSGFATPAAQPTSTASVSGTTSRKNNKTARRRSRTTGRRRRPQEFLMPDGRRVLVALPEDVAALREKYSGVLREAGYGGGGEDACPQIEVVVHGSPEHRQYLQQNRDHQQARREALRAKYGASFFDEWDRVTAELDHVSAELEQLADHSASLGHNFSKFGYSATLRTFGGGEGEGGSGGASSRSGSRQISRVNSSASSLAVGSGDDDEDDDEGYEDSSGGDGGGGGGSGGVGAPSWHNQNSGSGMLLFKRPIVKQYFHKGLLWRASEETEVQSFELFFDLLYVGIIAVNGDHAAESADGFELLRFLVTFCLSWKIWTDVTQLVSWFETNDVLQRVEILFLFSCLVGVTVNMVQTFGTWGAADTGGDTIESGDAGDTYPALAAFYVTARLFMALYCILTGFLAPLVRGTMFCQAALVVVCAALWIASIHIAMPARLACVFVALAFDLLCNSLLVGAFRFAMSHSRSRAGRFLMTRFFDFYPAMNIEHKVERTNAFITLVLGYSVVGVLYQSSRGYGLNAFFGKAVLGLVQAFVFNWLYFDIDGANIHVHAIRRRAESAYIWQYAHLLFTLAFILSSAALTRLVVATDCRDAPLDALTDTYQARSSPTVELGLRLYYSTGLGVALLALTLIALCHRHKIPPTARLSKTLRLANRLAVAAIFCALPAAQWLTSLQLVATATGLIVYVLVVEIFGQSCRGDTFFGFGAGCEYTARCSQKRLDRALRNALQDGEGGAAGGGSERDQPEVDVNVLTQGEKHGAIYME